MKHRKEWEDIFDTYIDVDSDCIHEIYKTCSCDSVSNVVGESVVEDLEWEDYRAMTQQLVAEYFDL